jgi:hypothetical protein
MNRNVVVICLTAIAVSIVGVVGAAAFSNGDPERIIMWGGTTLGPLIAGIAAYLRVDKVGTDMEVVKHRTNGVLDRVFERLRALEQAGPEGPPAPGAAPAVTHGTEERPPAAPG